MSKMVRRLFEAFQPEHYELALTVDKEAMTFSGTVTIDGKKVNRPSQRLTFHQNGLKIQNAQIVFHDKKGDRSVEVSRVNHQRGVDEVRLHTDAMLYPGKYTVTMEFSGTITRPMNGIYPCFFDEGDGQETLIATQFESHHAREAFPSIDEPEAKATFALTLTTPKGEAVVSNTPIASQNSDDTLTTTTFERTPRMSTYLLAFVFGKLEYKEARTKKGVLVRVYAVPSKASQGGFALDVATKCLDYYDEYFNIAYPLAKCDLIALPDFASGAMENWGCITFREQTLLVDDANTSLNTKQYVAMVVAHELAHQWFGNLVTMRWWTDLWLNEGFASWIEHLAVDQLFPTWQMWTQFAVDETAVALSLDALSNTHPIEVPIRHPDEIRTIFDTISYSKGSSIINMLHRYLSPEVFRKGLQTYLRAHAYGNAETNDLWLALESVAEKPVKSFMNAWTAQPGYPMVHADVGENALLLRQERFFLNPKERKKADEMLWPVPLLAGTSVPEILDRQHTSIPVEEKSFVKLNEGQTGFYRVHYNATHLLEIGQHISDGKLSPLDRMGILNDALESAKAGYQSVVDVLAMLEHYKDEDNTAVWEVISELFGSIRKVMDDEPIREAMKPSISTLIQKQLKRLGWQEKSDDSHFDKLLRPLILSLGASADEEHVLTEINRRFKAMKTSEDIKPDFRGFIYVTTARHGTIKEYEKFFSLYQKTESPEEKINLAAALMSFKQPELIKRSLGLIDSDIVRLQDVGYWIAYSFGNRFAKYDAWEWVKKHWLWLEKNLGSDLSFSRLPVYVARAFSHEKFLDEFKEFFEPVRSPVLDRAINQGIETIEWQVAWRERDFKAVKKFYKL